MYDKRLGTLHVLVQDENDTVEAMQHGGYPLIFRTMNTNDGWVQLTYEVGGPCAGEDPDCVGEAPPGDFLCPVCRL